MTTLSVNGPGDGKVGFAHDDAGVGVLNGSLAKLDDLQR